MNFSTNNSEFFPPGISSFDSKLMETGKPVIEINTYLYIPFILFVFGAPLVFIGFLCYLQHRSKQLHRREWERLNNRRLSSQSGIYTGRSTQNRLEREERL